MDVLSELLRAIELRGGIMFRCGFTAPWGMIIDQTPVAEFHLIVRGSCCVRIVARPEPIRLQAGDVLLFAHGQSHVLLDAPGSEAVPAQAIIPQMPENYGPVHYGGDGQMLEMLCGYFDFDHQGHSALLGTLPDFIHIPGSAIRDDFPWLKSIIHFIDYETGSIRPGTEAVVDRLVEVMFIQIMRAYIAIEDRTTGLLGAIADKRLGRALLAMHREPGHDWSLEAMAKQACMSRSSFAAAFQARIGQTPMQYLTEWRMQKATAMLSSSKQSMGEIAEKCGYQSEASFGKAFKRHFGKSPGAFRRQ